MVDTICAISSATGEAGIGIVRMSGPLSIEIAEKIFRSKRNISLTDIKNRFLSYGHIVDGNRVIDEVLIVKMLKPYTYTREDLVEIYCHGGIISVRKILNLIIDKGARLAEKGEFTKRAFLNGRLDLSQAEAVIDLIKAKTDSSYEQSVKQLEGRLTGLISLIREKIMAMISLIVANIDFPEDEIVEAQYESLLEDAFEVKDDLFKLISGSDRGRLIRDGINTVILGKPNVGKSSLLNAMLKYERAIVTDIPGTTRDIIEDYINLDGILLKITDTAGIRETDDKVEQIGVERAKKSIEDADLIIALLDPSQPFNDDDREIIKLLDNKKTLILLNKSDLKRKVSDEEIKDLLKDKKYMSVSILEGSIEEIENKIVEMFFQGQIVGKEDFYVNNLRHVRALKDAYSSMESVIDGIKRQEFLDLIEVDLRQALNELGLITGETSTEDILDKVFKEFCIGK
ncbi:tRNA modification GTPase [Peptoniphilus koenoeneniae]|uniref:tRNA modification GTPase MnmE n=1 Tax=Peptoniphilus koenoeneniae TaxID=507751 RepID=A0ABU0AV85_9FIRM|nr:MULTISPECIES: tRNA uridine-5-carboxymethylaminomethyl(34) synthesis GTPase MnmE [Peptoniphilus]ERT60903.1 tRNA modification GTPase TrmE [Peptoniphilus sp. BV3C26]MDQ0275172.1 tRNA modification GTPase [Peptoniphilus koenoeneniae]